MSRSTPLTQEELESSHLITCSILRRLIDSRTLLSILLDGGVKKYSSAILDINAEENYLILDELFPTPNHNQPFDINSNLLIQAVLNGASIAFRTSILEIGEKDGMQFYKANFPKKLHYDQKRTEYRIKLPYSYRLPVEIYTKRIGYVNGFLEDISLSGLSMVFDSRDILNLKKGERVEECNIYLPQAQIDLPITVCGIRTYHTKNHYAVHGQFGRLSQVKEKMLNKEVARLQRELLRTYKRKQSRQAKVSL